MRGASTPAAGRGGAAARALALLAAAAVGAGCGPREGAPPRPTSIAPDRGVADVPVSVRIGGEGFGARVSADFGGGGGDVVDARFQALLGTTPLDDVVLRQDGALEATVPAGLALGAHDLTVVDPAGRAGTLAQAYRVLAASASAVQVARFRVEPVAPQVASSPFPVVVTALDATGAVVADYTGEVRLSDLSGAVVPASVGLFVDGQWAGTVEVRAAHAADVLTVEEPGGASGSSGAFEVAPAPAAAVSFASAAPGAQAGACAGPVTLALRDAFGSPTTASAPAALSVTASPAAGFTPYPAAGCAGGAAELAVPAGQGTVSFWFVATTAGPLELTASGPSLAAGVLAGTVAAGPPAALAFLTPPRTAAAGACSEAATIEVRDAWGNPAPAGAALALAAAPGSGITLYADACATPATSLAVPAGATTASLWFRGTAAGAVRISVSGPGLAGAAQDERVEAGAPATLAFATAPRTAAAGACSPPVVLEARDAFGNPAPAARATRLGLSATPSAGFALYADAACTTLLDAAALAAGASSVTLHYRGTAAGDVVLRATAPSLGAVSQTARVDPAAPAAIVFASAPQTVQVQACSEPVALALRDAFGNASAAAASLPAALAAAPAGTTFHLDPACVVPVAAVTFPAGAETAVFYFRPAAAPGVATVTATASGLAPASQAETIVAGAATRLAFVTAPQAVAAGACSGAVTVESQDALGNPVALSALAATDVSLAAPGLTLYAGAACAGAPVTSVSLPASATAASFRFRGTVAGPAAVTASAAGVSAARQTETIVAAAATQLAFATAAQTVTAGTCSGAVTVVGRDAHGNPAALSGTAPTEVSLAAPGLSLFADPTCSGPQVGAVTLAAGATAAPSFHVRGTAAGGFTVTASAPGLSASQPVAVAAAAATRLAFSTEAQAVTAGACSGAVTVEARDPWGNAAPVSAVLPATVALSAPALAVYADPACATAPVAEVTLAAGATAATLHFRGTVAGAALLAASVPGLEAATQTETIGAAAADRLAFATPPRTVQAGACSGAVTLEARDAWGNAGAVSPPAATTVELASGLTLHGGPACAGTALTAVTLAAGATTVTLSFTGTAAGTATITATAAGLAGDTQVETLVPGPAARLAFSTAAQRVAAGSCSGAVTLETRDAWDNPAMVSSTAETAVDLSAAALALHAGAGCGGGAVTSVAVAPGATRASFSFQGTTAGTFGITASAAGLTTAIQDEVIAAAGTDRYAWSTIPGPQLEGVPFAVTLAAVDAYGNPNGAEAAPVALSAPAGTSVLCLDPCTSTTQTAGLVDGSWVGTVAVIVADPAAVSTVVALTARGPARAGVSNGFVVGGRSPPTARLTATPRVVRVNGWVTLDATASSDLQDPLEALSVSWHARAGDADQAAAGAAGEAPWGPWTSAKLAPVQLTAAGVYRPRLAVRDTAGDVGHATGVVVVAAPTDVVCVVDTDALDDDNGGSTSCDVKGTDGATSLPEALRAANAAASGAIVAFSGTRRIASAAGRTLTVSRPVRIVAEPGTVVLDGVSLAITAANVLVSGLELTGLVAPITVASTGGDAALEDLYVHDGEGVVVTGSARLVRVRMAGCAGTCVTESGASAFLAVFFCELRGSGAGVGVAIDRCASGPGVSPTTGGNSPYLPYGAGGWTTTGAAFVAASVFTGFDVAVSLGTRARCRAPVITNVTFDGNATGIRRGAGGGGYVMDNVFTRHTVAAVDPAVCAFDLHTRSVTWRNADDGCASALPVAADPLFVDAASLDYRLEYASPAKDRANGDNHIEVDDAGPGLYLGAGPDRGGRETY